MTARFHELAAAELAEAVAYYDTKAEGLGDRLLDEVRAAVVYVEEFPESSPVIDRGVRRKTRERADKALLAGSPLPGTEDSMFNVERSMFNVQMDCERDSPRDTHH